MTSLIIKFISLLRPVFDRLSLFLNKSSSLKIIIVWYYIIWDFINVDIIDNYVGGKGTTDDISTYTNYSNLKLKTRFSDLFFKNSFFITDTLFYFMKSFNYSNGITPFKSRVDYRLTDTNRGVYFAFIDNNQSIYFYRDSLFSGLKYLWKGLKFWALAVIVFLMAFYYLLVLRLLPFNKIIFEWVCLFMFSYWLISGFVFFIKRYQFGKYTVSIQRFWRRSYILFWGIEGCLFIVFFYFTVNASSEPFYMYDQIQIYKNRMFSWRLFLVRLLPISFLIVVGYTLLISLKWATFSKNFFYVFILTFILSWVVWVEFYQFFHILNFYSNLYWVYDLDEHMWVLENEPRRTRIANHYNSVLMILKFWHIIFIYSFWIFFLLRSWEIKRVRYPLLSANLQNFAILYIFAWVSMYPWIKYYFRKALDTPFYWFYLNNRTYGIRILFNDIKLIYYGFLNKSINYNFYFNTGLYYYWGFYNHDIGFDGYRNNQVKQQILRALSV
jgi:hypothetical protein